MNADSVAIDNVQDLVLVLTKINDRVTAPEQKVQILKKENDTSERWP